MVLQVAEGRGRREPRAGGRGRRAQRFILSRDQINGAPVGERGQLQGKGVSQLAGVERRGVQAGKSTGEEETQGEQDGGRERERPEVFDATLHNYLAGP